MSKEKDSFTNLLSAQNFILSLIGTRLHLETHILMYFLLQKNETVTFIRISI